MLWHGLKVVKHVQNWCSAVEMLNLHWSYQWKKWYNTKTQWWKKNYCQILHQKSFNKLKWVARMCDFILLKGLIAKLKSNFMNCMFWKKVIAFDSINKSKSIRFQGNNLWQWKTKKSHNQPPVFHNFAYTSCYTPSLPPIFF